MKSHARLALISATAAAVLSSVAPAMAVMNTYMRADGAPGPVVRDGQPGWFKVQTFKWGSVTKPAPGNKPPRGGPGAFTFTKSHDSASTGLMRYCMQGGHIPKLTIRMEKSPGQKIEKYMVFNLRMTGCPDDGSLGIETYSMDYGSLKWQHVTPAEDKKPDTWRPGE